VVEVLPVVVPPVLIPVSLTTPIVVVEPSLVDELALSLADSLPALVDGSSLVPGVLAAVALSFHAGFGIGQPDATTSASAPLAAQKRRRPSHSREEFAPHRPSYIDSDPLRKSVPAKCTLTRTGLPARAAAFASAIPPAIPACERISIPTAPNPSAARW
jgi:hypothetical protein